MNIEDIITKKIGEKRRRKWLKKMRSRLDNHDFSIISNNCCAGVIYSDLGIQFKSPTINLYFNSEDFLLFVKNLKSYIAGELKDISSTTDKTFPVGSLTPCNSMLPAIKIYFMHYEAWDKAYESWIKRCNRINFENLFFLWEYNKENTEFTLIQEFDTLPIKKMIFSYEELPGIKNYFRFLFSDKFQPGEILKITEQGKRNIDEFDYVHFLNSK